MDEQSKLWQRISSAIITCLEGSGVESLDINNSELGGDYEYKVCSKTINQEILRKGD